MNRGVYIHETVEIVGDKRAAYLDYMCEFAPIARRERQLVLFGVWGAIGSTTRWPTAINLREAADWRGLAGNFEHETAGPELHDPSLRAWIGKAQEYRRAGYDRLLIAEPGSPSAVQAVAHPGLTERVCSSTRPCSSSAAPRANISRGCARSSCR